MRTGIYFSLDHLPDDDLARRLNRVLEQAETADYRGFDSCLVSDVPFQAEATSVSAAEILGALASSTHGIRLGTADRVVGLYHPARLVENYAVLDQLSNGRTICGIAKGEQAAPFDAIGVSFAEAESRFHEGLTFMRHAWSHDAFAFHGEHTQFPRAADAGNGTFDIEPYSEPWRLPWQRVGEPTNHLAITPRPLQVPYPPIWLHSHESHIAEFAGQNGLSCLPAITLSHTQVETLYSKYTDTLTKAGRAIIEIERPILRDVFVAKSEQQAIEIAGNAYLSTYQTHARRGEITDASGNQIDENDVKLDYLLENHLIFGDPDEVFGKVKRLQTKIPFNHVVCRLSPQGISHSDALDTIQLFAAEVITRLRS